MYNRTKHSTRTTKKLCGILLFFKLFGFDPYSESASTNTCLIIYSIIRICVTFLPYNTNDLEEHFSFYLTEMVMQVVHSGLFVGYLVFALESLFYRKVLNSFYTKYDELEVTYLPGNHSDRRVFNVRLKMAVFIFLMTFISGQCFYHEWKIDVYSIILFFYTLSSIVRCAQFVVYVEMIYIKLFDLCDELTYLKENEIIFKLYNKLHQNLFETKLENCRESYGKIHELVLDINQCFGWSLLCIVVEMFCILTSNGYWTYLVLLEKAPGTIYREAFLKLFHYYFY